MTKTMLICPKCGYVDEVGNKIKRYLTVNEIYTYNCAHDEEVREDSQLIEEYFKCIECGNELDIKYFEDVKIEIYYAKDHIVITDISDLWHANLTKLIQILKKKFPNTKIT